MLTLKSVTLSPTNKSNRVYGAKHVVVYLRSFLDCFLPSHRENLFLHDKGPLYQILLCCLSQHRNQAWPLLCHIISFLFSFPRQGLDINAIFAKLLSPVKSLLFEYLCWFRQRLQKSNSSYPFARKERTSSWEVTGQSARAHYGTWFLFYSCQYAINWCFTLNNQSYCSIPEYCNIIGLYYPSATNCYMYHKLMFYGSSSKHHQIDLLVDDESTL